MDWGMLGHQWAVNLLRGNLARGRMRHAYLFIGPEGVGRRTLAIRMVQALNCIRQPAPGEPCGECHTCDRIARMEYPDLAIVQAERRGGTLKVDQVRDLQRSLALAPYEGRYRVALLLRFEEAHRSASNALLKTLEEPPPQVVMLLTANNVERLLPTIVSRCEVIRLRPVPLETVVQGLHTTWKIPQKKAENLAHISGGRPGYAIRLFQNPEHMTQRLTWIEEQYHLINASRVERFDYIDPLYKDKERLRSILLVWISLWRDVLLAATGAPTPITNLDQTRQVESLAERFGLDTARKFILSLERTINLLERNVNPRLVVEILMLDMPYSDMAIEFTPSSG
jgi:DNA polymerase-3 subunit delta'